MQYLRRFKLTFKIPALTIRLLNLFFFYFNIQLLCFVLAMANQATKIVMNGNFKSSVSSLGRTFASIHFPPNG